MTRTYFIHIHKCAGTAIARLLASRFDPGESFNLLRDCLKVSQYGRAVPAAGQLDEVQSVQRLIMGHFGYGIHQRLAGDARYVTVLRDPLERALSHYGQHRRNLPIHQPGSPQPRTVAEWMDTAPWLAFNLQTRFLAGAFTAAFDPYQPQEPMARDHLAAAKANLAQCTVGVYERPAAFLARLGSAFGWSDLVLRPANADNPRPRRWELAPKTLARLEHGNRLDYELYDFALGLITGQ